MLAVTRLFAPITALINHYYGHPAYHAVWQQLDGKAIQVTVTDIGNWILSIHAGKLNIQDMHSAFSNPAPTLRFTGPMRAFMRLLSTGNMHDAKTLGLCLNGDLTLALTLSQALKYPPIDFTERLSAWLGDNLAVRLSRFSARRFTGLTESVHQLADNTTEYLQFETVLLPTTREVRDWMEAVDTLRDDIERLSAHITQLNINLNKKSLC
ncbi:MAG: hypothetical protein RLZ35_1239 [Pseudomonadota bacterium]|jgi:ubiquinone biosynthesis protein UbiJ